MKKVIAQMFGHNKLHIYSYITFLQKGRRCNTNWTSHPTLLLPLPLPFMTVFFQSAESQLGLIVYVYMACS